LDTNFFWGYNNLAWLMAVCPESKFRDGKKALEYAKKACDLSDWQEPDCVDTLAAAYAEEGHYKEAVKWEKKALGGLTGDNLEEGTKALSLYEKGKPYREMPKEQR
jgi:tetratricopeptide (TPR) repeat protein